MFLFLEEPVRDIGFDGSAGKGSGFFMPTASCLVNLSESFVLSLDDVEFVYFERVSPELKLRTFDMVFIFKDYSKPVVRLSSVPTENLSIIKEWLK